MNHPLSRSERRYAREVWRDHRRRVMMSWSAYSGRNRYDPTQNTWWLHSGKQCSGHGNRCMCNSEKRIKRRQRRGSVEAGRSGQRMNIFSIPVVHFGLPVLILFVIGILAIRWLTGKWWWK
jgi:hypothetical protein